jgi:hypothetical protein
MNRMRGMLGLCLMAGLALSGCEQGLMSDPAPTSAELAALEAATRQANVILNQCLESAARKFDDHKSAAATIGFAVAATCASQFRYAFGVQARNTDAFTRDIYPRDTRGTEIQMATDVVVRLRAKP